VVLYHAAGKLIVIGQSSADIQATMVENRQWGT
jgi:hypothetical protein